MSNIIDRPLAFATDKVDISGSTLGLAAGASTAANQLPDNHQVSVSNFPVGGTGLTNTELRASPVPVKDDFISGQIVADQSGTGSALTFTFSSPVDFIWVTDISAVATNISRVDPFGGTPAAALGIPVFNQAPTPINVVPASATVKVFAPSGATINVYGYRR